MARKLLLLNGIAVIGVVLNHSAGWGFVSMFWWTHRYLPVSVPNFEQMSSLSYLVLRLVEQLIIFSIPAFLFVSGFFVAFATRKDQPTVGRQFIGTRIRYLAIPYLLWSVIMLAFDFVQGVRHAPLELVQILLTGQATAAFYFIPLIIQLYLLSPLLVPMARNRWKLLLAVAAVIQVIVHLIRYSQILNLALPYGDLLANLTPGWFFPGNLFWFAFGIVFGFHQAQFKDLLQRIRWPLLAVVGIFFVLGVLEWEWLLRNSGQEWITPKETLVDNVYSLALLLGFLAFEQARPPFFHTLEELGSRSFGVYLVHSLVLTIVARGIYHLAPWMLGMQFLFQPLLIASGLGVPLLLMELVKRTPARKIYAYQFG